MINILKSTTTTDGRPYSNIPTSTRYIALAAIMPLMAGPPPWFEILSKTGRFGFEMCNKKL
jgi:hypothetical protein